jgi:hypothetical protein
MITRSSSCFARRLCQRPRSVCPWRGRGPPSREATWLDRLGSLTGVGGARLPTLLVNIHLYQAAKEAEMKWVTRERPKTDRIACPWLIRNFIDLEAEFLYVPADGVLDVAEREGAHSFDAPGAAYTHRDGLCSFEVLLEDYPASTRRPCSVCRAVRSRHGLRPAQRDPEAVAVGLGATAGGAKACSGNRRSVTQAWPQNEATTSALVVVGDLRAPPSGKGTFRNSMSALRSAT